METMGKVLLVLGVVLLGGALVSANTSKPFIIINNDTTTGINPTWKIEAWNGDGTYIGDTSDKWNRDDLTLSGTVLYKATVTNPTVAGLRAIQSVVMDVHTLLPAGVLGPVVKSYTFTADVDQRQYSLSWNTRDQTNGDYELRIVVTLTATSTQAVATQTIFAMVMAQGNSGADPSTPGTDWGPYILGAGSIVLLVLAYNRRKGTD
jgi:hypothetical protein